MSMAQLARKVAAKCEVKEATALRAVNRWANEGIAPEDERYLAALKEILGVRLNGSPGPRVRVTQRDAIAAALTEINGKLDRVLALLTASSRLADQSAAFAAEVAQEEKRQQLGAMEAPGGEGA